MLIKNKDYIHTYLKQNDLVISLYWPKNIPVNINMAIIIAQGAINTGDTGKYLIHEATIPYGIPVFIPDYYGHSRSGKKFTPENCAKTILDTRDLILNGKAYSLEKDAEIKFNFKDCLVIGNSFGGWIPWYINQFFPTQKLDRFGLINPFIDFKSQAQDKDISEEDIRIFLKKGRIIFANLYRGIEDKIWDEFLFGINDDFNPLKNLASIANASIATIHCLEDDVIYYKRSIEFYEYLKKINPKNKFLKILETGKHGLNDKAPEKINFILDYLLTEQEKGVKKILTP